MKFSVVVTTYRRYDTLEQILSAWLKETPDVTLANGGRFFKTALPIKQHVYTPDPGNKIRFISAQLTQGDFVVLADDDVLPRPMLLKDLHDGWSKVGGGFVGIIGRRFTDPDYFKCPFFRADKVDEPKRVGFIGVIYFAPRRYMNFDMAGLEHRAVDDLYWQMVAFPKIQKHVVPTKNYKNLPSCNDPESIFKTPESRKYRREFFAKHYHEIYR